MKKVFSNSQEVSHIWASRTQDEGRANSIFFDKDVIYSYGKHFPIAKFYDKAGKSIVLFNVNGYSVTTAKHKSIVSRSVSHYNVIEVDSVEGNHEKNIAYFLKLSFELKKKALSAKKQGDYYMGTLENLVKDLKEYCLFFDIAINKEVKDLISAYENKTLISIKESEKIKNQLKIESALKREKTKERKEEERKEEEKLLNNFNLWKKGQYSTLSSFNRFNIALRIKDGEIETSRGAKVPLQDGINLFKAIKQGQNVEGFKVGCFTVNRIEGDFIKIGCHTIELKEVESLFSK